MTPVIEYSTAVLARIVDQVVKSYLEFPFGGREVGGVLFGEHHGDLVKILAFSPIACEHSGGPRFTLSTADEKGLQRLLTHYHGMPELKDLVPVGWYHSRTLGDLSLTTEAIQIYNRFFPEPWHVALVIRPEVQGPTRAGFFVRETDKPMRVHASYKEFEAGPVVDPPPPAEAPPADLPVLRSAGRRPPGPPPQILSLPSARGPSRGRYIGAGIAAIVVAGAATAFALFQWNAARPGVPLYTGVSLRVFERGGRLHVAWDPRLPTVRDATQAVIEVVDGEARVVYPVELAVLRQGSWSTIRASNQVRVRFQLETRDGLVEELSRFLHVADAANGEPASGNREHLRTLSLLREQLQKIQEENGTIDRRYRELAAAAAVRVAGGKPAAPPPSPREVAKPFSPPQSKKVETLTAALPAAPQPPPIATATATGLPIAQIPVTVDTAPARPPDVFPPKPAPSAAPPAATPKQQQPSPPPAPEPVKAAYSGPPAGRLIWIGSLAANTTLTIEGRKASAGNVNAQLPGAPVRIGAYPAEMSSGGFTVFSTAPKYARGNVVEAPGAANGWNRTAFRPDARRAADIVVVEAPSAANNWSRVVLRSGPRAVNAIMLEWELAQ